MFGYTLKTHSRMESYTMHVPELSFLFFFIILSFLFCNATRSLILLSPTFFSLGHHFSASSEDAAAVSLPNARPRSCMHAEEKYFVSHSVRHSDTSAGNYSSPFWSYSRLPFDLYAACSSFASLVLFLPSSHRCPMLQKKT